MLVGAALVLCGCAIGLGGASAGVATSRATATLAVTYIGSSSIQVKLGDGTTVRSGSVIPAGSYTLQVDDPDYPNPKFTMNGPGVSVSSDLNSTGMGIDRPAFLGPYTLQTSSTYSVGDANMGSSVTISFTTSASATASGSSSGGSSSSGSSSSGSSGSSSSSSSSSSGSMSSTMKMVGTLKASVSTAGKPALMFGGKSVKTLKAGRYTLTVADQSKKAAFIVWKLGSHAMTLSAVAATGSSSHTVTLSAGKWFFEGAMSGPRTYFTVTS